MINIGQHADARDNTGERAVIYARTNREGPGWGLQDQIEVCRAEARHRGITVVDVATDTDVFADLTVDRPGWSHVVDLIESGVVDLVLCTDISRITRRWEDMTTLMALHHAHNVDFLSLHTIIRDADNPTEDVVDNGPASSQSSP